MNNIVLLTKKYPFGNGETYIYPELEYCSNKENVIVFPIGVNDSVQQHRTLPKGIKMIIPKSHKKRIFDYFSSLFSVELFKGVKELLDNKVLNRKTIVELFRFVHSGRMHYKTIKESLKFNNITDFSNLILYSYWMDSVSLAIAIFKKKHGCRVITRCHGGDLYDERLPWNHQFLRKYIVDNCDLVCPISKQGENYLKNRVGNKDNIVFSHLGIVDNGYKSEYQKSNIIVSCSNAIKLKRIDLIIEALSKIELNYVWYHFGDGEEFSSLKQKANQLLPEGSYEFFGNIPNEKIIDFYKENSIRVFLNVSETEGIPVSIMEALSLGIPVIATDVGGVSELIFDGENGTLLPADLSSETLAKTITKYICCNEDTYKKLCKNSRESFLKGWENTKNYSEFYNMICDRKI